jgi:hypothetical protein
MKLLLLLFTDIIPGLKGARFFPGLIYGCSVAGVLTDAENMLPAASLLGDMPLFI